MKNQTNKKNAIIISVIVTGLLFVAFSIMLPKKSSDLLSQLSSLYQSSTQPPPVSRFDWFDNTDAPVINDRHQLSTVWQSKPRCCVEKDELTKNNRAFYKACYVAMKTYPSDEDINAKCLWLMGGALETREQRLELNETYIKRYFYYDKKLDRCANCKPANVSARIAQRLAQLYKSTNRFDKAIKLLERMNDERSQEISDWILAELSTQLGKYYLDPEYIGNDVGRIQENYFKLKPHKNNEALSRRFDKLEEIHLKILQKSKG